MAITIRTEKQVNSAGVEGRVIKDIELLKYEHIPDAYKKSPYSCFQMGYDLRSIIQTDCSFRHHPWASDNGLRKVVFQMGEFYSEKVFQERLAFIHKCGENLKYVNETLRKKRENWKGEETFII